jgi:hypothetical protein
LAEFIGRHVSILASWEKHEIKYKKKEKERKTT